MSDQTFQERNPDRDPGSGTKVLRVITTAMGAFFSLCLIAVFCYNLVLSSGTKAAVSQQKAAGVERKLVGIKLIGRGVPRHEYKIATPEGEEIGHVTSGTMSPTLKVGIAMGYVKSEYAKLGTKLAVVIRDRLIEAEVVKMPFV